MDTVVSIKVSGDKQAFDEVAILIEELDALFDRYDEKSDIYKINHNGSAKVSSYTAEILTLAKELCLQNPSCDITCGELLDLWNVTGEAARPDKGELTAALSRISAKNLEIAGNNVTLSDGSLDLGAVAKGYACDKVYELLDGRKVRRAVVSFGSSAVIVGGKEQFVTIVNPFDDIDGDTIARVKAKTPFVSTSGGYERGFELDGERYNHIFDLNSGCPLKTDLASVTVFADSGIESDFYATVIYIGGKENLAAWLERDDISLVAITNDRQVYLSNSLKDGFTADESLEIPA